MGNIAVSKGFKRSKKVGLAIALVSVVLLTQSPRAGVRLNRFMGAASTLCVLRGATSREYLSVSDCVVTSKKQRQ